MASHAQALHDESDVEEEALVNDYQQQVNNYDDELGDLTRTTSAGGASLSSQAQEALQAQLAAAATPLEFQATLETKFASYDNYCSLFHFILNSDGPVDFEAPSHFWAWDVIDEFIYQFESFCRYRNRVARSGSSEEEAQLLKENPNTWGCYSVLNVLYSLIQRSQINEQLAAIKRGEDPAAVAGEYGARPLYHMLGYFSIIGLLRVHVLLGDFSLALKTLDDIELNKKAMFARVMAAHFTTYYYVGFSYMMMRRYADAIRMFSHILVYVSRTKNFQKGNNSYDAIAKKNDQMLALIAICASLHPTRLDDTLYTTMDLKKLAGFLEVEPEQLRSWLLVNKQRSRQIRWTEGPLLDGEVINTNDLDYAIEGDLIHISEAKTGRRLVDWYLRNLARIY
ncbi:eukaryotic translation initiation factor 3 [Ascosphaera apis ARSEF 7405]|uniref:Eukaryotic translation initiation factor 3 n=1 Tax=Ascosphaera apis ARSEF 7405 TaxID=392613 RepID=A0A166PK03_9EURO|nr:eukaryotic translation initiation factor 3 [Ascosphaera apis ARSEF 7405]